MALSTDAIVYHKKPQQSLEPKKSRAPATEEIA